MTRLTMIYMSTTYLLLGLVVGYSVSSQDVLRIDAVMEEMVK